VVETFTDETNYAFNKNWIRKACQQAKTTVFLSRRNRTYVFLGCEPAVFTLAMVAGSGSENSNVFNFLCLLKESKQTEGKIASF